MPIRPIGEHTAITAIAPITGDLMFMPSTVIAPIGVLTTGGLASTASTAIVPIIGGMRTASTVHTGDIIGGMAGMATTARTGGFIAPIGDIIVTVGTAIAPTGGIIAGSDWRLSDRAG